MKLPVLVMIEGPAPTDEDRELFDSLRADQFLNVQLVGKSVIAHAYAAAVDPKIIPEGYRTSELEEEGEDLAPGLNPSVPPPAAPSGSMGIRSEEDTPPDVVATEPVVLFGKKK